MDTYSKDIENMPDEELRAQIAELRRQRRTGMSMAKKKVETKKSRDIDSQIEKMSDESKSRMAELLAKQLGVKLDEI